MIKLEKAKELLKEKHGDVVSIVESSYKGMAKKCTFVDKEYGEFTSNAYVVIQRGSGHKQRGLKLISESTKNRHKTHSQLGKTRLKEEDFRSRLPSFINFDFSTFKRADKKMKFIDEKYGEYWMAPYCAFKGQTHPIRGKRRSIAKKTFPIEKIKKRLNSHITLYEDTYINTQIIAKFHDDEYGDFEALPHNMMKGLRHPNNKRSILPNGKCVTEYCREMNVKDASTALEHFRNFGPIFAQKYIEEYKNSTSALEMRLRDLLIESGVNAELFNKSAKVKTPNNGVYRPDIKIVQNNRILYVDIDGLYRHSISQMLDKYKPKTNEQSKNAEKYHMLKSERYEKDEIDLLQFREDELDQKPNIIVSMIRNRLGLNKDKVGARETKIVPLNKKMTKEFLEENHLMGYHPSSTPIGLMHKDKLVAVMTYKKNKGSVEISRFCSLRGLNVIDGFSRLLKYIERKINPESIKSYLDLRYSNGASYTKIGFTAVSTTLGFKWTDYTYTYNRTYCRATKFLTEEEHALELGLERIYDAGQRLYEKTLVKP